MIETENNRRHAERAVLYDPEYGLECYGPRVCVTTPDGMFNIPAEMTKDPAYRADLCGVAFDRLRCRYDFEFWAWRCTKVYRKKDGKEVAFTLNRPQRRFLAILEGQRRSGLPIRAILLKARQWGGSTLTQYYMAWMQLTQMRNWNSIICSHLRDTSTQIRGMLSKLIADYPPEMWDEEEPLALTGCQGSQNIRMIRGRNSTITIGTAEKPEASRGLSIAMAHLSEVAFWRHTRLRSPEDMVQAVVGGIDRAPGTVVVMESTARGIGTFFHRCWLDAVANPDAGYRPMFVPWYEIDDYQTELPCPADEFFASLSDYERALWNRGLTLEQICWYRGKRADCCSDRKMQGEYPTTPEEAFSSAGDSVFPHEALEKLRQGCLEPESDNGGYRVWAQPQEGEEYVVTVDVGGRTDSADYSVILVTRTSGAKPEVVAQWRGHLDYDLLAAKAAGIARLYNTALLVIESNTPEQISAANGEPSVLLDMLGDSYPNFYYRHDSGSGARCPGFHMNRRTKAAVIANLQRAVREGAYIERDEAAIEEMLAYEQRPNGSWGAPAGNHDDLLMTRAIALYVIAHMPPPPPPFDYSLFARE